MLTQIVIRTAEPSDLSTVCGFIRKLATDEGKTPDQIEVTEARLSKLMFGDPPLCGSELAFLDERPVGFAFYSFRVSAFKGAPAMYVDDLFLDPDVRGRGFGREVMNRLIEVARAKGCWTLEWLVFDWNLDGQAFFKSLGAVQRGDFLVFRLAI